MQNNYRNDSV